MNTQLQTDHVKDLPNKPETYKIKGRTFIVEPIFKSTGKDTMGSILLRLMQSDNDIS